MYFVYLANLGMFLQNTNYKTRYEDICNPKYFVGSTVCSDHLCPGLSISNLLRIYSLFVLSGPQKVQWFTQISPAVISYIVSPIILFKDIERLRRK